MEPSYQTRKMIGRLLALCCAAALAGAFFAYEFDPLLQQLPLRKDTPLAVAVLTQPAMRFSYNPHTRKTLITIANAACKPEELQKCFPENTDLFFIPQETVQNTFWTQFKENLSTWRFNPAPLGRYVYAYVQALAQHRTNINPAQFLLLSLELPELTASDFAVEHLYPPKKKNKKSEDVPAPEPNAQAARVLAANQPLKVVILNASSKRGLAESLKQYLRAQHAKGLLQVDVYDTGNYPTLQEHSFIEDYSGQLVQVTKISRAIGISGEIHSQKPTGELYYDSRIIIGQDFKMPL